MAKIIKFKITDNWGNVSYRDYEWTKENGIPCELEILENIDAEKGCNCSLSETLCEGDCIEFDQGYVEVCNG